MYTIYLYLAIIILMNQPIITVNNISNCYKMGEVKVQALSEVSLDIHQGDFLIITGRNGSGKSTLLHQLGLLDKPDTGKIHFDTTEVTHLNERKRTNFRLRNLGYIFQEYALIEELSALENVILPAMMIGDSKSAAKRGVKLLSDVGLESKMNRLPSQLSGGEQQRVAIARALINNPKVLLADEPTANLDTAASKYILNVFKKLNHDEQHTIVMITHEPDEEKYANRLIKLDDGRIVR
jgi:putative ABC transport system ATP-binding protein